MKILLSVLSSAITLFLAAPVEASNADFGYITQVYATNNGAIIFNTSGTRSAPPACQGSTIPQRFAIDASTTVGQAYASVLITAYTLHKRILIVGTGTCTIWGDTETVQIFQIEDDPVS